MLSDRGTVTTFIGVVLSLGIGFAFLVWPQYRSARATFAEIETLEYKIENSDAESESLEQLADKLQEVKTHFHDDLKEIPLEADMAGLMAGLTIPVDHKTLIDQQFTAGQPVVVNTVPDQTIEALPLKVEMLASFGTVYSLIETVESMNRLVRISSLQLERSEEDDQLLVADIELQAIFEVDPPQEDE